jgi:hypothetical protein
MSKTDTVSPLRQRMIEDMAARKLNPHTQRSHIHSCKRFVLDHGMAGKFASQLLRARRGRGERLSSQVHMRKSMMHVQACSQKRSDA